MKRRPRLSPWYGAAALAGAALALAAGGARLASRLTGHADVRARGYSDVTAASGIRFSYRWHQARPLTIRQTMGPGVAIWDYDGDGRPDLYLVGDREASATGGGMLLRNRGDGTFEDTTSGSGLGVPGPWMGCAVGDVDNDDRPDLLLTGFGDRRLFRNLGGGRFRDVTRGSGLECGTPNAWYTSAAFADVDRDGRLDLAVGQYVDLRARSPLYCHDGGKETVCSPETYGPQRAHLFLGDGRGRFRDVTTTWGVDRTAGKTLGVAFGDVNDDGFPDLYLANDEVPCDLFINEGGRRFDNRGRASGTAYNASGRLQGGMGVDFGDYDRDGRLDLAVSTFGGEPFSLYHNDGDGFFTDLAASAGIGGPTAPYVGWGTRFLDYDNDGWLDLFFANGHVRSNARETGTLSGFEQPLQLFRATGEGQFELASGPGGVDLGPPMAARGAAVGDINNDGYPDILVASAAGSPRLLLNEPALRRHWIGFDLRGRKSNRMAIGARVTLTARSASGTWRQVREVTTGGSYLSASDARLLFGLGTGARVESVDIVWPSGIVQRITDAAPDRYYPCVEPERDQPRQP